MYISGIYIYIYIYIYGMKRFTMDQAVHLVHGDLYVYTKERKKNLLYLC